MYWKTTFIILFAFTLKTTPLYAQIELEAATSVNMDSATPFTGDFLSEANFANAAACVVPLVAQSNFQNVSCHGGSDGKIVVTTPLESYFILGNDTSQLGQTAVFDALSQGTYTIHVFESTMTCSDSLSFTIAEPEELFVETMLAPISCPGDRDGVFSMFAMGGTPPYSFSVDGKRYARSNEFGHLRPGRYTPAFRDANNCVVPIAPFELADALPLSVTLDNLKLEENKPAEVTPIINNSKGEITYIWTGNDISDLSCNDCPKPLVMPTNTQAYKLKIIDEAGCEAAVRFNIFVEKNRKIYVPTLFSPNLDGINDHLTVHGVEGTEILSFRIFDHWGQLVFSRQSFTANDEFAGWDGSFRGEPVAPNVFTWLVKVRFSDGTVKIMRGNSTLIR